MFRNLPVFHVLAALAILAAGFLCARVVGRFAERSLQKTALEKHLQHLLVRAVRILVLLFTVILALDKFGVQVTALVAGISVAGLAGGLALQGVLANIAGGVSIMFSRVFRIGDSIEIGTVRGQVQAINLTTTLLRTPEDARVIVPNRQIVGEVISNYTEKRRVPLTVDVGCEADLEKALQTMREDLAQNGRILKAPEPEVGIVNLVDSGVRINLRPWCKAEGYCQVQYDVYRAILERFQERKITIPYPVREIRMPTAGA